MAEINVTVARLARATGANYTDNKTAATAGNNYNIPNDGNTRLILECTAGGTATIVTPNAVDSNAIADLTVTTTAAKVLVFGPFPTAVYGTNLVVIVSANTNLYAIGG